jgi:ligand-binding sensor domain-containing protein
VISLSQKKTGNVLNEDFPFQRIEYINSQQGLNGNEIYQILQDREGFMWFLTNSGLNRYDGYSFRSWTRNPEDHNSPTTISGWYTGFAEDNKGIIWFGHKLAGFYSLDKSSEKFVHYSHQNDNINSLISDQVFGISAESNTAIWIAALDGLDKFDPQTNKFSHFTHNQNDPTSISSDTLVAIVSDNKTIPGSAPPVLWLINNRLGIDYFNTTTGKLIKHFDFPFMRKGEGTDGYFNISAQCKKNDIIWLGSNDDGIYGFNTATERFLHIEIGRTCEYAKHLDKGLYHVWEDHSGNLWTVNDNNELVYFDRANGKFYFYKVNRDKARFLDITPFIFEDNNQKIWIGTEKELITVNTNRNRFINAKQVDEDVLTSSGNYIFQLHSTKQGQMLAGAVPLNFLDKKTNILKPFHLPINLKTLEVYAVRNINEDDKGIIWLTGDFGIISYDPNTGIARKHQLYENSKALDNESFRGIFQDSKGRYWALNIRGLYIFDVASGKASLFNGKTDPAINNKPFRFPFIDSKGIFYLGTEAYGFVTFNPESNESKSFLYDVNNPTSSSNESVTDFIETKNLRVPDGQGFIWFGTMGRGLGVFDPVSEKFRFFTAKDGLVNNIIYSLVADKNGKIWLGTRNGISCFTPPEEPFNNDSKIVFRNYTSGDGIPEYSCNFNSAYCDTDGTLYFGTRGGGIFYFHPDSLKHNEFIPPVYITEFRLKNNSVSLSADSTGILKSSIEYTKRIKLNYQQNIISFSFVALNYIHSEKNQYAYKLENYDEDWIITDASKRFATYTNLNPGNYVFKVKGSNNDGVWNETPTQLLIIITPPFWQTVWFKILVALSVTGLVYAFYRYRIGQVLLLQRIRNKIAADLHDDIGSTLNSISVYSEVAKKDPSRKDFALQMIGENSRKIIESMSDIVWSINPENDSFDKIIFRMRSLTYNILKVNKIDCSFKADETLQSLKLPMHTRRNFYLIFKEALNNLVKYSGATRASIQLYLENKNVTFILRDNGIGFDSNQIYSGNGINNMKRRAAEIKAELNIESAPGNGTSIELNLKV